MNGHKSMTDEKSITTSIPPVPVTVIGTGDGKEIPANGVVAVTPDSQPNLAVIVVTPVVAMLIRFLNVYIGTVVGLLGAAMTSNAISAPDFFHLVLKCAGLAFSGAAFLALKDLLTIGARLERKYPLLTGSV